MKNSKTKYFLAIISLGIVYGTMFNLPYMKYVFYDAMIEAMGCTNTQLGLLLTVYSAVSVVGIIPGGWVADRFAPKKIIVWSAFIQGLATFFFVLNLQSYTCAMITWIICSFTSVTAFWSAILKAVSLVGSKDEQGRTFGYYEAFCGMSAALTNVLALAAYAMFDDSVSALKSALFMMGAMNIVGAVLVHFLFDEKTTEAHYSADPAKKVTIKETFAVFKLPRFYLVSIIIFCSYGFYTCQSYITPYFTSVLGTSVVFAGGLAVFKTYGTKFIGGPIAGIIADKIKSASKVQVGAFLIMLGMMLYIVSLTSSSASANLVTILTILTVLMATICSMSRGTMWATMDEADIPKEITGTAIAIASNIGFNLPDIALPTLIGSWLDKYGNDAYSMIFTVLIAFCVLGAAAAFLLIVLKNKAAKQVEV